MYRVKGDGKMNYDDLKSEPSDFGHSEAREGDRTWGRYFVKLPDGRVQTVKYWADHTGYHAEVLFQGEAKHPGDPPTSPKNGGGDDSFYRHSPAYNRPLLSVSEADEPYKQQLPVSYAQDAPALAYAHSQDVQVAYSHADSFDQHVHDAPALLGPSLKPFYSSQPAFVAPPNFYLGAASEGVKVLEKPLSQQQQPKKSARHERV